MQTGGYTGGRPVILVTHVLPWDTDTTAPRFRYDEGHFDEIAQPRLGLIATHD